MNTPQQPPNLSDEISSEFDELIYNYGRKIYTMNCLDANMQKLRIELVEIEEKLKEYGRND